MLEWRKYVIDVGWDSSGSEMARTADNCGLFARCNEMRQPFAVARVEDPHRIARLEPEDVDQIMALCTVERCLRVSRERGGDIEAGNPALVFGHAV